MCAAAGAAYEVRILGFDRVTSRRLQLGVDCREPKRGDKRRASDGFKSAYSGFKRADWRAGAFVADPAKGIL
jgi:hypothetical protein